MAVSGSACQPVCSCLLDCLPARCVTSINPTLISATNKANNQPTYLSFNQAISIGSDTHTAEKTVQIEAGK